MEEYLIKSTYTIKEVMDSFEINHDRNAIAVNDENKMIGVVSQGDIIKALAAGISTFAPVETIMNRACIYLKEPNMRQAYDIMRKKGITLIPVVDDEMQLKRVITLDDIFEYLENGK